MFTKLEKQIILFRLLTVLAWVGVLAIHAFFFSIHFFWGFYGCLFFLFGYGIFAGEVYIFQRKVIFGAIIGNIPKKNVKS